MRYKDLEAWLDSNVTRDMLSLLAEHREASYRLITDSMLEGNSLKDIDLTLIAEYRGQVNAFDLLLNTKDFLREKVDPLTIEVKEGIYEEVNSVRGQFNS